MAKELISGDRALQAVKPGAKRVSDGGGLYLLPAKDADGRHAWRFDYSHGGKRKTISLGTYPEVGLGLARDKARESRQQVAAGQDPSAERQAQRAATAAAREAQRRRDVGLPPVGSFEEVARRWYEGKKKNWSETFAPKVIRRLEVHVFPYIGARPIAEILPKDARSLKHTRNAVGELRGPAHRVLKLSSDVLSVAVNAYLTRCAENR